MTSKDDEIEWDMIWIEILDLKFGDVSYNVSRRYEGDVPQNKSSYRFRNPTDGPLEQEAQLQVIESYTISWSHTRQFGVKTGSNITVKLRGNGENQGGKWLCRR